MAENLLGHLWIRYGVEWDSFPTYDGGPGSNIATSYDDMSYWGR
jgi:hypothetical protein